MHCVNINVSSVNFNVHNYVIFHFQLSVTQIAKNVPFAKPRNFQKCDFHHFTKRSLFTKNHEKFGHLKIWLRHYDFFAITNVLTGAPKNAKICLYCIRHGKP